MKLGGGSFRNQELARRAFGMPRTINDIGRSPKLPRALRRLLSPYTGAQHRGDGQDGAYLEAAAQKRVRKQSRRALEVHGAFYALAA